MSFWIVASLGNMESSPESFASSGPTLSVIAELWAIQRKINQNKSYLRQIDTKGGRCLELVDRYLSRLREEFIESISQSKSMVARMVAEMEVRFDKVELEVEKWQQVE